MTTEQAVATRSRRPRGQHPRSRDPDGRKSTTKNLPEYLEAHQVEALIRAAPNPRARLLFLIEWRAGLRISEALALEARDLSFEGELPSLHVREGKGSKPRIVPVHPELRAALTSALEELERGAVIAPLMAETTRALSATGSGRKTPEASISRRSH